MNAVVWVDGALKAADEPIVSAQNHGLTVGDGVFETLAVRKGEAFALTRHLVRLQYSMDRMGMSEIEMAHVREGVAAVMDARPGEVQRIRITVVSGPGPMSSVRGKEAPNIIIWGGPSSVPEQCRAVRAPWKRNERSAIAGVKSTSYGENVVMAKYAADRDADEALMSNTFGFLCEGTGSNIFIEKGGEIVTPPLSSGCLAGITRGLALEWGARAGIRVRIAAPSELPMSVLDDVIAGHAFAAVTSSTRNVQHVVSLDGLDVGRGPLLTQLAAVFDEQADAQLDPAPPRQRHLV
jgi:branched-chain amino acid aminotransferase